MRCDGCRPPHGPANLQMGLILEAETHCSRVAGWAGCILGSQGGIGPRQFLSRDQHLDTLYVSIFVRIHIVAMVWYSISKSTLKNQYYFPAGKKQRKSIYCYGIASFLSWTRVFWNMYKIIATGHLLWFWKQILYNISRALGWTW
jgi:hypothetical protein